MKFQAIRSVGYVRLDNVGKKAAVTNNIAGSRRRLKRVERLHQSIDFQSFDEVGKLEHVVNGMQVSEMRRAASKATRDRFAEEADKSGAVAAAINGTMEMFKRKNSS
jgi:predicted secreted protein